MNTTELQRIKSIVQESEKLEREIKKLEEMIEVGKTANGLKFVFSPWNLEYQEKMSCEEFFNVCSKNLIEDLAEDFRQAFLDIVKKRLEFKVLEFDRIKI